ncbi:DUF2316 family protein [Macrococcus brunensis]|uniref:DUF2316 family protein n=1 Tax=Macrococcus brunensis TaxID=198483 RepID=UPI001EF0DB32|nr:DUF2316 family protein [Macrococcus brunensis]ULG74516.1 DUF2316 family protein [Macrococcus brunensis]
MSLNKEQRAVTSQELKSHSEASSFTLESLADKMKLTPAEIEAVLNMQAPNALFRNRLNDFIHLIWDTRDAINENIRQRGQEPETYTYLKGEKSDYWFLQ